MLDCGAGGEILDSSETVRAQAAAAIDEEQAWCAAQLIAPHGLRDRIPIAGGIHADWELDSEFVKKNFERLGSHRVVILEDRVQTNDGDGTPVEMLEEPGGLWCAVKHAAWAQHLEGMNHDDLPAQIHERKG